MNKKSGFTLIEMLIVMFIIGLLSLLVIPNLATQQEEITEKTDIAIVRVVEDQYQMYLLNESKAATELNEKALEELVDKGYITQEQKEAYEKAGNKAPATR